MKPTIITCTFPAWQTGDQILLSSIVPAYLGNRKIEKLILINETQKNANLIIVCPQIEFNLEERDQTMFVFGFLQLPKIKSDCLFQNFQMLLRLSIFTYNTN